MSSPSADVILAHDELCRLQKLYDDALWAEATARQNATQHGFALSAARVRLREALAAQYAEKPFSSLGQVTLTILGNCGTPHASMEEWRACRACDPRHVPHDVSVVVRDPRGVRF